ncbi:unnamed protein product, partial [Rotaria sp. Silwood1]
TDTSILTSTRDQEKDLKISKDNKRRKAILPTPHKPRKEYNLFVMNSKKDLNSQDQSKTLKDIRSQPCDKDTLDREIFSNNNNKCINTSNKLLHIDSNCEIASSVVDNTNTQNREYNVAVKVDQQKDDDTYNKINISNRPIKNSEEDNETDNQSQPDEHINDDGFDSFIIQNFVPFSGKQNGGKDDVKKWIEEIEHLLDLAHIPESTRLDLISYSLRGDALEWFKNNRSSPTSWSVIQFEVRKKKPSSTAEFLEYAKEAEELMQLSNMTIDNTTSHNSIQVVQQQPISSSTSIPSSSINQSFTNASNNYPSKYSPDVNRNYRFLNNRNTYSNPNFPSFSSFKTSQNKVRFNSNSSRPYRQGYSNNSPNTNRQKFRPPQNNSSSNTYSRQRTANTIDLVSPSANIEALHETLSSSTCSRCNQFGHEASACPSF